MNFSNAIFEKSFGTAEQFIPSDLPEICFSGRSNVGKSSLINKLLGRKNIARVSQTPGKTVTVNFYKCNGFRLVDLPGYGFAFRTSDEKERFSRLTEAYFGSGRNICLCLALIDMRHSPTAEDMQMLEFLKYYNMSFAVVLTKCDKLNKTEFKERLESFKTETAEFTANVPVVPFSALKGTGTDTLLELIEKAI